MIQLLHLSDLHFGPHSRFQGEDPRRLGKAFHRALTAAGTDGKVDLVVVTGDVAEAAKEPEFSMGAAFLTALAGELGLGHERFVFVPGNHDVSRHLCRKVEIDQDDEGFDDGELRRRLDAVKLQRYEGFLKSFYGVDDLDEIAQPLRRGARLYSFPELRLSVAALDSCEVESHRREDHRGALSREQAQAVLDAWRFGEVKDWLKVVAVHHNPVATVRANVDAWRERLTTDGLPPEVVAVYESDVVGFDGREHLEAIAHDARVQLVLHGHHHARDEQSFNWPIDGRAHVLSAGSLTLEDGKLPRDEPASARVIRLVPEEGRIEADSLVYVGWARTEGELRWGAFVADPAEKDGYRQRLDLPPGFETTKTTTDAVGRAGVDRSFLRAYRNRMRHLFSRWDLAMAGVAQAGGAGRPIEATLDDMYLPLRLADTFQIEKTDLGAPIEPDELLRREHPLVVRGPGGAGKTTWMRWTFRRLVEDERALPLMIVLRDLSRRWAEESCEGEERSLDGFLDATVAAEVGGGWEGELRKALESPDGPRPVLLVDGWDELGDLGEELRGRLLGFMEDHPRLLVVVSSRPYGEGRPSSSEGFEVLDIQPLADGEIAELARRFYVQCYGEDDAAAGREAEHFGKGLRRSPEAQALARTALLLTMMLLISRSRPLPDKRHQLYEACIENLLTALPDRKEQEGAQLQREQWRPEDSEERMRVVAALAYGVQSEGYKKGTRQTIVRTWDEMESLLPQDWKPRERTGFLRWLAGPAALLVDRTDGKLAFTHLSFQEYLTARHLDATHEGERRADAFAELLGDADWWETLLLWSAVIERDSRERLDGILRKLEEAEDKGLALIGMMLADGLGPEAAFEGWIDRLLSFLQREWSGHLDRCSQAWAASRQDERKEKLHAGIRQRADVARWVEWLRLTEFSRPAFGVPPSPPQAATLACDLIAEAHAEAPAVFRSVAAGRILCGSHPIWPTDPWQLGLFQLWPSHRRLAGLRLQTARVCGAEEKDLRKAAASILSPSEWDDQKRDWARDLARDLARYWARYWARDLARDLARDWKIEESNWLLSYASIDLFSFGRAGARAQIACAGVPEDFPEGRLLQAASRLSFDPGRDPSELDEALARHEDALDPLWPALAHHLARRSTADDRTLLEDLARHPEKREPPLQWGLRFIVRGDVMDDDGSVVTLDELCDELGLERLPYVEEMPEEIDLGDEDEP